jgi:branched-subunit amino acid transport protein
VLWPTATNGETDPARLAAACVTLLVGLLSKNVIAAILSGAATLYGLLYVLG